MIYICAKCEERVEHTVHRDFKRPKKIIPFWQTLLQVAAAILLTQLIIGVIWVVVR